MGRVCVGRLCYGPSLQWAEFAMGRDVQLPKTGAPSTTAMYNNQSNEVFQDQ